MVTNVERGLATLPAEVIRVLTSLSAGSVYDGLLGLPSGVNDTG